MCEPCVLHLSPTSYFLRLTSYVLCLASYVLRPTSCVLHLMSYILLLASYILYPVSRVLRLTPYILRLTSYVLHLASSISYRPITKIQGRLSRALRSSSKCLRHLLTDWVFNRAFSEVSPAAMQTRVAGWHTLQIESAMRRLR